MLESEMRHFEYFKELTKKLEINQTIFLPIWKNLTNTITYISAKHSYSDAMLLTHAVEDVIEKHYKKQIQELTDILEYYNEGDLYIKNNYDILNKLLAEIKIFMEDEIEHKHTGMENSKMKVVKYTLASFATKLAVVLSEKY
jgi:demethoxyubiquinone hydroxylase (CLK1/Coq7/Cat5 family)